MPTGCLDSSERDTETGNAPFASRLQRRDDEFGAHYYTWRFGRWLSADWSAVPVPYANLTNPQTLNPKLVNTEDRYGGKLQDCVNQKSGKPN
jgi:hypothetical protein